MLPLQLMVAPLRRLGVNKPTPIEKVGSQDSVLSSIGAFITGKLPAHDKICRGEHAAHANLGSGACPVLVNTLQPCIPCGWIVSHEMLIDFQGTPMRQPSVNASRDRIG